jgi:NADPH-dependent 2,4-dienoyl-CoA reductase/sulfur reductase-like enzyme
MTTLRRVVVVGASAAGTTAAEALRRQGFDGQLTLVGDEDSAPYDRPPLSKQILTGQWDRARATLRTRAELEREGIELLTGIRATAVDLETRSVALRGGGRLPFDGLIIATGLRARRLQSGRDLEGMYVLRTMSDAVALRAELSLADRVVVIGAGFLGTEVAAAARSLRLDVTIVTADTAPLRTQLGAEVGQAVAKLHLDQGVRLADGAELPADVVVAAVGSTPATDWLAGTALTIDDGVRCDEQCRAAPGVYAAGDVANWPQPITGRPGRCEQRANASRQAIVAARNLLAGPGRGTVYAPVAYAWTDQFGSRIQLHGWRPPDARFEVVEGRLEDCRFVGVYR